MIEDFMFVTYDEGLAILDTLHHASKYLASQYSDLMTPEEATAHFQAREIIYKRNIALLDEMELEYRYGCNELT
jgi:hypothetical protein